MSMILDREIEGLKRLILSLSTLAEEAVVSAVAAVRRRDPELARRVIDGDHTIDELEVKVEEECLKLLALHQPVAGDLRFIVAVLKMNDEIERIGDLATNIADRAILLADQPPLEFPFDVEGMAQRVRSMLRRCIDALIHLDGQLAREVWADDSGVDAIHRDMYVRIQAAIRADLDRLDGYIYQMSVSRFLERIADHATSIAKDVLYMTEGEIVRHRGKEFKPPRPVA